jgi:hypothetical protein
MRALDDATMATRQRNINTMSGEDRQIQEAWAQNKLQEIGTCPGGLPFDRSDMERGYWCTAHVHFISDEELASGRTTDQILNDQQQAQEDLWQQPGFGSSSAFSGFSGRPGFSDPFSGRPW